VGEVLGVTGGVPLTLGVHVGVRVGVREEEGDAPVEREAVGDAVPVAVFEGVRDCERLCVTALPRCK
jgi:hypothetical protein